MVDYIFCNCGKVIDEYEDICYWCKSKKPESKNLTITGCRADGSGPGGDRQPFKRLNTFISATNPTFFTTHLKCDSFDIKNNHGKINFCIHIRDTISNGSYIFEFTEAQLIELILRIEKNLNN